MLITCSDSLLLFVELVIHVQSALVYLLSLRFDDLGGLFTLQVLPLLLHHHAVLLLHLISDQFADGRHTSVALFDDQRLAL